MEFLRLSRAAKRLGVHPVTLRLWAAGRLVTVVRVTHEDRLARFGAGWLLLEDFTSLVTTFAGRLYGMRSAAARRRLLAESARRPPGGTR
jgi:predicted site-specific integrase-resolvase